MTTPLSVLTGLFIQGVSLALITYWRWKDGME